MAISETLIRSPQASSYLQRLCKHWSHKYPVEFTPERGRIEFSEGRLAEFVAEGDALTIQLTAADPAVLERFQSVVIDHLKRFAFKEDLGEPNWTQAAA